MGFKVALVADDDALRLEMARAFDGAPVEWSVSLHRARPADADVVVVGPAHNGTDAVVFDPADPAGVVERVRAFRPASRAAVFALTSATGGSGVTTLALHLAAAMDNVCVLEVDEVGGLGSRLGLEEGHLTWCSAVSSELPRPPSIPCAGGFGALPGERDFGCDELSTALDRLADSFDYVIVDAAQAAARDMTLRRARAAVLLLAPTAASIRRSLALLAAHSDVDWAVVVNRVGPGGELNRRDIERALGRTVTLELPCTPALRDAEDAGRLLRSSWPRYSARVQKLARTLESL